MQNGQQDARIPNPVFLTKCCARNCRKPPSPLQGIPSSLHVFYWYLIFNAGWTILCRKYGFYIEASGFYVERLARISAKKLGFRLVVVRRSCPKVQKNTPKFEKRMPENQTSQSAISENVCTKNALKFKKFKKHDFLAPIFLEKA